MESINTKYRNLMIIEDNTIDLYITREVIKRNNFAKNITEFNCAVKAFDHFISIKNSDDFPEIIFTDVNLGINTGFDFLDLLVTLPKQKTHKIKIYVISSTIDPKDINKIYDYDFDITFKEKHIDQHFLDAI